MTFAHEAPITQEATQVTGVRQFLKNYLLLTKPSIMLLVVFTGAASLIMEGSFLTSPLQFALVLSALFLTGGAANAYNQYFERDIDARMSRTRTKRPLPSGRITASNALIFSTVLAILGLALFALVFNWIATFLALGTILFYSLFYTLWLKPNTPQNIVIGGAAGAMGPIIAWAAVTKTVSATAMILFLIIFFWTPPHFWSLALFYKEDYQKANLPMLPIVRGEKETRNQILIYSYLLVLTSFLLFFTGASWIYLAASIVLGIQFIFKAHRLHKNEDPAFDKKFFLFTILYLFVLFTGVIIDSLLQRFLY